MLFRLPLSNIKRSIRDYAIYFFTLVIGVSVFYVFNAIGGQAAMLQVDQSNNGIVELLKTVITSVSIFVAIVLALLIVYASNYLMKRRNREFAVYMVLGMSKGRISALILIETMIIGIGSLIVGLILGVCLSQLMSAVVAGLFEADMTKYKLSISGEALILTVFFFVLMYLVVMFFNTFAVTRMKLIDLIQSGRKAEKVSLKNPVLCTLFFIISVAVLIWDYYQVTAGYKSLTTAKFGFCTLVLCLATALFFWSFSGLLLRLVKGLKGVYFRGLNAFTFRQISSKINTMVLSMTVICLMLFLTICALSSSFALRNSMNRNLTELCPVDMQLSYTLPSNEGDGMTYADCRDLYREYGYDLESELPEHASFFTYEDEKLTMAAFLGDRVNDLRKQYPFLYFDSIETMIGVSDYNRLMKLYGRDGISLENDEYVLLCDYKEWKDMRDMSLKDGGDITAFGHTLHSKTKECQDGFVTISAQHINIGIFVVPDAVVAGARPRVSYFMGNYSVAAEEEKEAADKMQRDRYDSIQKDWRSKHPGYAFTCSINTRIDIYNSAIGISAVVAFLGLYIGVVFLIACGAILALKSLSESVDSITRYEMLRKIGAEEGDISSSLFRQTGIFFLIPLLLAALHSVFGLKFVEPILESMGTGMAWESIAVTSGILLAIYGGYFLVTYFNSRRIIRS